MIKDLMKEYEELSRHQKEEVKECIRMTWLEDAKEEYRMFPNCDLLPETIKHLEENDKTCEAMIEDQLEPENIMFQEAMENLWIYTQY